MKVLLKMSKTATFDSIHQKINNARHIFLTAHQNCPDAVGSLGSLGNYIASKEKKFYSYLAEPIPKMLKKLTCCHQIQTIKPDLKLFDLYLIVDSGDLKQTGMEEELTEIIHKDELNTSVINIDHHKTNDSFGHLNLVDKTASSTCELIYYLLNKINYSFDSCIAECLLTGIVSDTGNFTNAATNENALKIAADLIWQGANIFQIIQTLYSTEESINTLRLWGKIFQRLTYNPKYDIAISYVLQTDYQESNVSEEVVDIVANLLNYIRHIKAGILLKEKPDGTFKVSLRSTHPGVDVSTLAKILGGGGHKKAAGFSVDQLNNISQNL